MRRFNNAFRVVVLKLKFELLEAAKSASYALNRQCLTNKNIEFMARCCGCGKNTDNTGAGLNMGTTYKPMCERCYEHGGDDE